MPLFAFLATQYRVDLVWVLIVLAVVALLIFIFRQLFHR